MKTSAPFRRIAALGAALGLAFGVATQPANAADGDSLTFLFTSDHCTGGCGPQTPGFGQVVVTDLAGDALGLTVTLFNGNKFVNTGFDLTFAFNLAGNPTITYSNLTAGFLIPDVIPVNQQAANTNLVGPNVYGMNGTGVFEYGVLWSQQGGGSGTPGPLSFQIAATGLSLASLEQNPNGNFFVADILSGTTGFTGVVDATVGVPPTSVPEPETYALMLAGLGLMGFVARRRKQKAA